MWKEGQSRSFQGRSLFSLHDKKKKTEEKKQGGIKRYLFYGPSGGAERSAALMRHTVMQQ